MSEQRYQKLFENIYEMMTRRNMGLAHLGLAVYLRSKYCRFGQGYYQSDEVTCRELNITRKILRRIRKDLQTKGVIKYNTFNGRGKQTVYYMLDSVMAPEIKRTVKGTQTGNKGYQKGTFSCPNGHNSIYKNKERIIDKNKKHTPVDRIEMSKDIKKLLNTL